MSDLKLSSTADAEHAGIHGDKKQIRDLPRRLSSIPPV